MATTELKLGMQVKDKVTGAVGTITGKAEYLYGEPEFRFEYMSTDGIICSCWFTSDRYTVIIGG